MDASHKGVYKRLLTQRKGSYCFTQNGALPGIKILLRMIRGLCLRFWSLDHLQRAARVNTVMNVDDLT